MRSCSSCHARHRAARQKRSPRRHIRTRADRPHSDTVFPCSRAPSQACRLAGAAGSQASTCCSLIVSMNCGIAFIIVAASDVVHKWALSQEGLANPTAKPQAQQFKLEVCAWGRKRPHHFRRSLLAGDCSKQRGQARINRARELHVKCRRGSKEDGEEG